VAGEGLAEELPVPRSPLLAFRNPRLRLKLGLSLRGDKDSSPAKPHRSNLPWLRRKSCCGSRPEACDLDLVAGSAQGAGPGSGNGFRNPAIPRRTLVGAIAIRTDVICHDNLQFPVLTHSEWSPGIPRGHCLTWISEPRPGHKILCRRPHNRPTMTTGSGQRMIAPDSMDTCGGSKRAGMDDRNCNLSWE
jgi:hypothetical protein